MLEELDYRPVMSMGPTLLKPFETKSFSFVSFFIENVDHPCPSIEKILLAQDTLVKYHQSCFLVDRENKPIETTSTNLFFIDNINLYPNPFKEKIFIESNELLKSILIYNDTGELVLERYLNSVKISSVETERFSPGLYFVKINSKRKLYKVVKI